MDGDPNRGAKILAGVIRKRGISEQHRKIGNERVVERGGTKAGRGQKPVLVDDRKHRVLQQGD